jgi:hypothetical protein
MPSFRYKGAMEQQIKDLLLHYQEHHGLTLSMNDVVARAIDREWRAEIDILQPEPPHVVGWVRGRTTDGREGWKPQMSDGAILDEIDEDVGDPP